MRLIRNSALGVGIVSGVVFYALIRFVQQVTPTWLALDLIVALGGGLLLGICYYIFFELALRRITQHFRTEAAPLVGGTLSPIRANPLDELRQTHKRVVAALARHDRYNAITHQLLASDDLAAAFRVIAEHAAQRLPINGAVLFRHEGALLRPAATWNMDGKPLPEAEEDCAIWRAFHENRPLLLNHADNLGTSAGIRAAALLVVPLVVADRPVGVLALVNHTNPVAFEDTDLEPARFFANQSAIAMRHAQIASAVRGAHNRVATLYQISRDLGGSVRLDEVLQRVLTAAAALTESQHGTVLLLDEQGERITHRIALDSGNMAPLEMVAKPMMRQGLAGWVVRERRAALVQDTEQDSRWLPGPGLGDLRAALVAPLLYGDRALGIITLAHNQPGHYAEDHLHLLEALGMQAALAIENVRLSNAIAERQVEQEYTQATPTSELIAEQTPSVDTPARQDANLGAAPEQPSTHDVVAVLADMRGLARASERLPPEVLAGEILNVYFQVMNEAILRHNGYADKRFGDAVLAIFGHPQSRPDDTLRAVQTAIEMRQAAARLCTRWRVRLGIDIGIGIGIARGRAVAFVPAVREHVARQIAAGDSATERREYALIGDAVTLAGRLQALARSGEVLAAAEVIEALDGAATAFDIEALQPLPIAGKTTPQRIYRIGEPGATQRRVTNPHDLLKGGPPTFR